MKRYRAGIVISVFFLALCAFGALFADFLAPYDYRDEERSRSFHPPSRIHFWDEEGRFHLVPFVYATHAELDPFHRRIYREDKTHRIPIRFFIRNTERTFFGLWKMPFQLFGVEPPAKIYLFGADSRGRDYFSRILYGARISLSIGILGALLASALGLLVGGISGYVGGWVDQALMRAAEFFIMIPGFYLLLALRSALPPTLGPQEVYFLVIAILSLIGWGGMARVIRGMVLSIKEADFVTAARVLGVSESRIFFVHVIPHTLSYVLIVLTLSVPGFILGESALSLLGLGIQDPEASWGNLLAEALSVAHLESHPWVLIPGLFIMAVSLVCNYLGDSLRELR